MLRWLGFTALEELLYTVPRAQPQPLSSLV